MKKLTFLCFLLGMVGAAALAQPAKTDLAWWQEARFGMFIHFGAYAVPARGEWVKNNERLTNEAYQRYVDMFNPTDYNPREWARLAKAAGMKYAVMTAKHHDGYCLFDSKLTNYTSAKYLQGRDLVREYLDAFRAEGLRVGLYYSVIDWHHPDYPHYGDQHHPQRDDEAFKGKQHQWDTYLQYLHGQVRELTTNYGKLDIMWFDFSYGPMKGEKWKAKELVDMVRKNQPGIILNNRLMGDGAGNLGDASALGDFETPEQGVPDEPRRNAQGQLTPWETCLTLNNHWGYHANDHDWKSPELVVHTLVNCVSKGGNLLLNVGPDARGQIPPQSVAILQAVGQWMQRNGASIYGCGPSPLAKPDWGRFTQRGNKLYAHLMHPHIGHINLKGYQDKVLNVKVLATGVEAFIERSWWGDASNNNVFINVKKPTYQHVAPPDPIDTVFEIALK